MRAIRCSILLFVILAALFPPAEAGAQECTGFRGGRFVYKRSSITAATLEWHYNECDNWVVTLTDAWRAGAGSQRDECKVAKGWLPDGRYALWGHWDGYDASIKGRVWWLQDMRCDDGTLRTELFIHSEETASNGQDCGVGDNPYCWEGDHDYRSLGCIKVSHVDVARVHTAWHEFGGPTDDHGSWRGSPPDTYLNVVDMGGDAGGQNQSGGGGGGDCSGVGSSIHPDGRFLTRACV